jgi:hypothetical protein
LPLDTILTSARSELAALSRQIAGAVAARDQAQQAHDRLAKPAALLEEAVAAHAAEKAAHDAQLVEWYSNGCAGDRPPTPPSLLQAEHRIGELRRDIGANDGAMQAAAEALGRANEALAGLSLQHRSALYRTVVGAAKERLHRRCVAAMLGSLQELSVVEALSAELRGRGLGANPDPDALSASRQIDQAISIARQSTAIRADLEPARRFLDELAANPEATLPDPGEPIIEHLEPRMIKPLPDGSNNFNRGPEQPFVPPPDPVYGHGSSACGRAVPSI